MSSPSKNIFGNHDPLSADEMERYLSGAMSPEEMNRVEQKMLDDELSSDAMEGYKNHPVALAEVGAMAAAFKASIGAGAKGGFLAGAAGKMIVGGTLIAGTTAVVTIAITQNNGAELTEQTTSELVIPEDEIVEDITFEELDVAVAIEEEEQIDYDVTVHAQPIAVPQNVPQEQVNDYVAVVVNDRLELKLEKADPVLPPLPEPEEQREDLRVTRSNRSVTLLNHLLVVDYSNYFGDIELNSLVNNALVSSDHVEARYEVETQHNEVLDAEIVTTLIPYLEYLEMALDKFEEDDFSGAVKDFETIRKQYPEDVNAHFYGGLCYYNLDKMSKAIDYFQHVQENPANTFDQDAQYYEAKAWIKKGNDVKAREVLEAIVELNDFYKGAAEVLLQDLE